MMNTNPTDDSQSLSLVALVAANETQLTEAGVPRLSRAVIAWDPHEVWRTRILPYQRQQRSEASGKSRSD